MTVDPQLTPEDERVIERAARLHLYHTLASRPEVRSPRVLPSMVSDYVDGTHPDTDGAIARALRTELPLRRLYRYLLERRRIAWETELVAAAGGAPARSRLVLENATLYWREIPNGAQVLRLVLDDGVHAAPNAKPVLHLEWDTGDGGIDGVRIVFPGIVNRATQHMLKAGDPCMERLLADAGRTNPSTRYRIIVPSS